MDTAKNFVKFTGELVSRLSEIIKQRSFQRAKCEKACFNEAEVSLPRKDKNPPQRLWRLLHFNEAGAFLPRKITIRKN